MESNLEWKQEPMSKIPFALFEGHEASVNHLRFVRGAKELLSASEDTDAHLWDIETTEIIQTYGHNAGAIKAIYNKMQNVIISCSVDRGLHLFDKDNGDEIIELEQDGIVTSCDFSSNGLYFACTVDILNVAHIYDSRTNEVLDTVKLDSTPTSIEFSPNSERIAIGTIRGKVIVYDMVGKKMTIQRQDHTNAVSCVTFDHAERILATASWDKSIRMTDVSTGEYRSKGTITDQFVIAHHGAVSSIRIFSASQLMVSGGYDKRVMIWNINDQLAKIPLRGHQDWVTSVDGSKNGKRVISGSRDGSIRYWNIERLDEIPLVIENKREKRIRTENCAKCCKPFSVAQIDETLFNGLCVFCRLEEREQYFDDYEVPMARRTNDARALSRTSFTGARQVRRTLQSTLSMHNEQDN
jgi:WD40 repeat protein